METAIKKKKYLIRKFLISYFFVVLCMGNGQKIFAAAEELGGVSENDITPLTEMTNKLNQENDQAMEMESIPVFLHETIGLWGYHKAIIDNKGHLYLWGYNSYGQLGDGTTVNNYQNLTKIMDNVVSVSLGYNFSAAITENGDLYTWGANDSGKLGNGKEGIDNYSSIPVKILSNVLSVSLGGSHGGAITKEGSLYVWGSNLYGQLGNSNHYQDVLMPVKLMDNVAAVECGDRHMAVITKEGNLYIWGINWCGQLGNGTWDDSSYPIKLMENVSAVSCGASHTAAITKDGNLYMWGDNSCGELGISRTTQFQNTPVKVMEKVIKVSCGEDHTAALTENGDLYIWGANDGGQLGNGKNGAEDYSDVPIKIMTNVVDIMMGQGNSAAITKDGSLYIWGNIYSSLEEEKACCNLPIKIMDNAKLPEIYNSDDFFNGQSTGENQTGTEGFVYRLYNVAMGREADETGFNDWNSQLKARQKTAAEVARGFIFSEEFKNFQYNDVQYVKILYRTMFGREADEGGLNGWVSDLENGMSREYVYRGFAESAEFSNLCSQYGVERGSVSLAAYRDRNAGATGFIARLYTKMLGRGYDENGLEYWCKKYHTQENTIEEIATVGFLHSQELQNLNLSDEEFVKRMYRTFLNREAEEAGLQDWVGRLKRGEETRDSLVYGFTNSREFANLKKEYNLP